MFIYTVKASRLKFFAMLISSMAILLTLASVIPNDRDYGSVAVVTYDYNNIVNNDDRVEFLEGFGYTVDESPVEIVEVKIPQKFDSVYEKYNDVQRAQGLNLKRYTGKNAIRYTYKINNYKDASDGVYANLLIYNNKIIAGDVYSMGVNSFLHGFEQKDS